MLTYHIFHYISSLTHITVYINVPSLTHPLNLALEHSFFLILCLFASDFDVAQASSLMWQWAFLEILTGRMVPTCCCSTSDFVNRQWDSLCKLTMSAQNWRPGFLFYMVIWWCCISLVQSEFAMPTLIQMTFSYLFFHEQLEGIQMMSPLGKPFSARKPSKRWAVHNCPLRTWGRGNLRTLFGIYKDL